jgi:hypothetical protein
MKKPLNQELTAIFTPECVERCQVLPYLRQSPQQPGVVEVYIPPDENDPASVGEWVRASATEAEGMITLACEPTSDGFRAVYRCTPQQYAQAWQASRQPATRDSRIPRHCGSCQDQIPDLPYTTRTTDDHLVIEHDGQSYQFRRDEPSEALLLKPALVKVVLPYMQTCGMTTTDSSFAEVAEQAVRATRSE